jgi:hypothetical protein
MQKDASRRRFPLPDRIIEVIDDTLTGEVLLDEALKLMKTSEKMSASAWIDLMSGKCLPSTSFPGKKTPSFYKSPEANLETLGETWNLMKIGYQLKQVRERLAKGLVDKGILRTEKRNFLLFDMATHPVADGGAKEEIRRRVRNLLTQRTVVLPSSQFLPDDLEFRTLRSVAMVCAAYAANVLENALSTLGHEARERAFAHTDELLADYSQWPFGRKAVGNGIGANLPQVITDVSLPFLPSFPLLRAVCLRVGNAGSEGGVWLANGLNRRSTRRKTGNSNSKSWQPASMSSPDSTRCYKHGPDGISSVTTVVGGGWGGNYKTVVTGHGGFIFSVSIGL